ncbi:MAG: IS21 family transposase, partial [Gemmatimonadales bacterium]
FTRWEPPAGPRPLPDWQRVHTELERKHVTLELLWEEYKSEHPEGYAYTRFCERYRQWSKGLPAVWMHHEHKAGEKLFADSSGDGIPMIDRTTGEVKEAQLFVAVMGASNYTYAEATDSQTSAAWVTCVAHAFEFLGGVPALVVPDQPRAVVRKPCRYDPQLQAVFEDLARHFDTCILPARPRKARDKAKVEVGVLLAQRWIIAVLRNETFFSIAEINAAIRPLLEKLNSRVIRRLGRSRKELFETLDRPALKPLPARPFEPAWWKIGARVNLDYHVEFEKTYYSVPYRYAHKKVDVRATLRTVEIFFQGRRIATHPRASKHYVHVTEKEHMPRSHREHAEWTPSRIVKWAESVGPSTAQLVTEILASRPHPEQGYRACLGILRLGKRHGNERLEKACLRAVLCGSCTYRSVNSILRNKLEDQPLPERSDRKLPVHENLRGSSYYSYN